MPSPTRSFALGKFLALSLSVSAGLAVALGAADAASKPAATPQRHVVSLESAASHPAASPEPDPTDPAGAGTGTGTQAGGQAGGPVGNVAVAIPLTNTPRVLRHLCAEMVENHPPAYPATANRSLQGLIQETGGTVAATQAWCQHYLALKHDKP